MRKISIPILTLLCFTALAACQTAPPQEVATGDVKRVNIRVSPYSFLHAFTLDTTLGFTNYDSLYNYRVRVDTKLWKFRDSVFKSNNEELQYRIDSIKFLNEDLHVYQVFKFLKATEKKQNNLFLLAVGLDFSTIVSIDDRIQLFNQFPKQARESALGVKVINEIKKRVPKNLGIKISSINNLMLKQVDGSTVTLKSLLSRPYQNYLLVFGASWCSPCRYESQLLKQRLSSIDTTSLKIIGISVDERNEKWLNMVNKDKCPWTTVRDAGGLDAGLAKALQVNSLPSNILLDKNHNMIDRQINIELILRKLKPASSD